MSNIIPSMTWLCSPGSSKKAEIDEKIRHGLKTSAELFTCHDLQPEELEEKGICLLSDDIKAHGRW